MPPAGASPHRTRLAALRDAFRRRTLDGLLVVDRPGIRYLSGFTGSSGLLLVAREDATLVTDFRYEEQAAVELDASVGVWVTRDDLIETLAELLSAPSSPRLVGYGPRHVTVADRRELGERCGGVVWEESEGLVERLRAAKDPAELERLRSAVEVAQRALRRTLDYVEEGVAERELAAELGYALRLAGSGPLPFEPIVAAGERTSLPHARPGDRRLREGDLLLFDLGAESGGYCSDLTRTFVLGSASAWQREIHEAVEEARRVAVDALVPGRPGCEVDALARARLAEHGLVDRFGHSTGHGIGLEVHEDPRLSRRSEDVLQEGHVVTVEPGVYLPGRGGVRIEDDVAVTGDGPCVLSDLDRALVEL